jgi:hypothetical protein
MIKSQVEKLLVHELGKPNPSLINYWPINNNTSSFINSHHLKAKSPIFVADRKGVSGGAVHVINKITSLEVPADAYFKGDVTVTGWVQFNDNMANQVFFDFGLGHARRDNFRLYLSENSLRPCFELNGQRVLFANQSINLNVWFHYALSFKNPEVAFYIDGKLIARNQVEKKLTYMVPNMNFIGRSNKYDAQISNADFDEIKIFSRALSQQEIEDDMRGLYAISEL